MAAFAGMAPRARSLSTTIGSRIGGAARANYKCGVAACGQICFMRCADFGRQAGAREWPNCRYVAAATPRRLTKHTGEEFENEGHLPGMLE